MRSPIELETIRHHYYHNIIILLHHYMIALKRKQT